MMNLKGASHGYGHAANAANTATKAKPVKPDRTPSQVSAMTDEQIRQIRALFDFRGWSKAELARHYDIKYAAVSRIVDCLTRAKINHSEADVPKGL